MRVALDTNIIVYATGLDGIERQRAARDVIARLAEHQVVVPVQVLGELFNVLVRKGRWTPVKAQVAVQKWRKGAIEVPTTSEILDQALNLSVANVLSGWDSIILAAAAGAGCRLLLSEDMQDGFSWGGLVVANPLAERIHPLLVQILGPSG